jgi:D-3-phosphoglycerate dehydrogenase / 2-oxoglutarate reductase
MELRYKILISAPYFILELDRLRHHFNKDNFELLIADVEERLNEGELMLYAPEIHGAICGDDAFSGKVLEHARNMKVISKWGTGIDSIDLKACECRGIKVYNTPDAFTEPVSDTAISYILSFARGTHELDASMKGGKWIKKKYVALNEVSIGIIGFGNIGRAIAKKMSAFGSKVYVNDIKDINDSNCINPNITVVTKEELLRRSDFISINCDLNTTSRGLIGYNELSQVKRGAVLINTARGSIVNEGALVDALIDGKLAGAALDVYEREPLDPCSPLRSMSNVLLAPHNSNSSELAWDRVHSNTINNLFIGLGLSERVA